ncbi:metallophosphoesterase family protein [candidate division KSB1 bacterium]|nr:metallophosphoesterase family protein [candidate division KSB1 bacterium]
MRMTKKMSGRLLLVLGGLLFFACSEKTLELESFVEMKDFDPITSVPVKQWKFHPGDLPGAQALDFDDSKWRSADPHYNWGTHPICWFRKEVTVPDSLAGKSVWMKIMVDDKGIISVDGEKRHRFDWYGKVFLTPQASGGEKFLIAVKGLNGLGSGWLLDTELMATPNRMRYEIDEKVEYLKPLTRVNQVQVNRWRYRFGENEQGADPAVDDSEWEVVDVGNRWDVENSVCWLRKRIVIPEKVNGFDIAGSTVSFSVSMDDGAEIYLDGEPRSEQVAEGRTRGVILTEKAQPGDEFFLAVKGINTKRAGILLDARLTYSTLQPLADQGTAFLKKIAGLSTLVDRIPDPDPQWGELIKASLDQALQWPSAPDRKACHKLLADAEKKLLPVERVTADYPIQIKGPYLQNVTQTSITIMWETDTPGDSRVCFGLSDSLEQTVYSGQKTTIHEVTLDDLQPETRYSYRAVSGKLSSELNTFRTAIERDTPFRFVVWADNHNNADNFEKNINRMILYKPDLAINAGDMVLTGADYNLWGHEFFVPGRNLFKNTPLYPSLGNHEYGGYGVGTSVVWYEKFFSLPGNEYYYSYHYGNSHFIHLNPHTNSPFGVLPDSEQYAWLISELESDASKNAAWRFVFFHEPAFTEPLMTEHIVPLLEKYKVTLQFSGHLHLYARHQDPKPDGPIYIITGGGGGTLSDRFRRAQHGVTDNFPARIYKAVHHFCLIDIDGDTLNFRAIDIDGNCFDSFKLIK